MRGILALVADRLAGADFIRDTEFDGTRLVVIDNEGAVFRIEAVGEGFVDDAPHTTLCAACGEALKTEPDADGLCPRCADLQGRAEKWQEDTGGGCW